MSHFHFTDLRLPANRIGRTVQARARWRAAGELAILSISSLVRTSRMRTMRVFGSEISFDASLDARVTVRVDDAGMTNLPAASMT